MGRLFWKFFFAFWLALLTAAVGVGTAMWWRHLDADQQNRSDAGSIDHHAGMFVAGAAQVLKYGGVEALRELLNETGDRPGPMVYAVDDQGKDILERPIAPELLQHARHFLDEGRDSKAVRIVEVSHGQRYLLFAELPQPGSIGQHFDIGAPPGLMRGIDGPPMPPPDFAEDGPGPAQHRHHGPPSPWPTIVSGLLASLLFSAALAWYFATPIRSLRKAFAAAAEGHLETRVAESMGKRQDELADLGRDFDHMAARLASSIGAQQRLLHDVSHELRSPLARMQAAIGLAQQQPDKIPATLERMERESQRISDLVGELLVLSRLESGIDEGEVGEVDLGDLLADIVEDARFEAGRKAVVICYDGFDDIIVDSRGELLHRAVENVLRNAVQYCRHGGDVAVIASFDAAGKRLRIAIDDQGPGVADADLAAIFQPFFRGSRLNRPDSIGLGLAIASRAVDSLGGSIRAANRLQGGLRVEIEVPFSTVRSVAGHGL